MPTKQMNKKTFNHGIDLMAPSDAITHFLTGLGQTTIALTQELGRVTVFFFQGVMHLFSAPIQADKIIDQVYFIGMKSVFVICLTGAFTGMVLGLQGYYTLVKFGSEGMLGAAVALSLIREMGPVLTAIMVVARAGSAMAAEIGIMRISEQIDALETMDINPLRFLFSPRLGAALISFPFLTAIFDVVGIFGGYLTGSLLLGINSGIYFARVESSVSMPDINGGFIKAFCFAAIVVTICCYQGYTTHTRKEGFGAKGVSLSTTSAVVVSCVSILVADYVLTSFLL
ncbi:putative ABC transporter, permease protein, involved in resistance to organic solvents (toluene) [Desulfosarcina variabilis str. Montpellier]|uniref:MlaE family ABC transporter permease n=1 Tax=Desulfosarcina variabilis TaxID=2300 RepID=UPI003AFA3EC8